jgi:hypothetical protein
MAVSLYTRTTRALSAGWLAARRVWASPQNSTTVPVNYRTPFYDRMWAYYANEVFNDYEMWAAYKEANMLYKHIRSIYNPTRRLVEFYVGEVYPGVLSEDAKDFPDGVPSAIDLSEDTPDPLRAALAQFWQWGNWQSGKDIMVRYSATLGNCLVELVDDTERRKVLPRIWWPGHVRELGVDGSNNVKAYTIEYPVAVEDAEGEQTTETYIFRKVVTKERIQFFKDGEPFDYTGQGSEYPNPYGFAPAVWVPHFDMGDNFGMPIMWGTLGKLDELNSLVSMGHDQLAKIMQSPVVLTGAVAGLNKLDKDAATTPGKDDKQDRERQKVVNLPQGAGIMSLPLDVGQSLQWAQEMLHEIEHDHPELAMYQALRGMSSVTGPGANRIMGDVNNLVVAAEASYNLQTVKLCQMAIAIAGERIRNGDWGPRSQLSRQQAKFAPFNLDSYARGDLDFSITPHPAIEQTQREYWDMRQVQVNTLNAMVTLGFPLPYLQKQAGATEDDITAFAEAAQATVNDAAAAMLAALNSGSGATPRPTQEQGPNATGGNASGSQTPAQTGSVAEVGGVSALAQQGS